MPPYSSTCSPSNVSGLAGTDFLSTLLWMLHKAIRHFFLQHSTLAPGQLLNTTLHLLAQTRAPVNSQHPAYLERRRVLATSRFCARGHGRHSLWSRAASGTQNLASCCRPSTVNRCGRIIVNLSAPVKLPLERDRRHRRKRQRHHPSANETTVPAADQTAVAALGSALCYQPSSFSCLRPTVPTISAPRPRLADSSASTFWH
jgi:hypothetical protein